MSMGTLGQSIMFLFSIAGGVIIGLYLCCYMARCLLVVVQGTAAGLDEVPWPDEVVFDWIWEALSMVMLGFIWLAPTGIVAHALRHGELPGSLLERFVLLAVPILWLVFPVSLLCALSGNGIWMILRPTILWRLLRAFPSLIGFYVQTGLLLVLVGALWYASIVKGWKQVMPVAAIVSGAAVLIHARLLGRLGWVIGQQPQRSARPAPQPPATADRKPRKSPRPRKARRVKPSVIDPWRIPDEVEAPPPPPPPSKRKAYEPPRPHEIEAYGLAEPEKPVPEPRPRSRPKPPRGEKPPLAPSEVEAYAMGPEEAAQEPFQMPLDGNLPADLPPPAKAPDEAPGAAVKDLEARLAAPPEPPKVPAHPMLSGIWTFPGYFYCRGPWFQLTLWFLLLGGLALLVQAFALEDYPINPAAGS